MLQSDGVLLEIFLISDWFSHHFLVRKLDYKPRFQLWLRVKPESTVMVEIESQQSNHFSIKLLVIHIFC